MLAEGLQMENLWNLLSLIFEFSTIVPACLVNWDPESSSLLKWMKLLNRQVLAEVQICALQVYCIKLSLQRINSLFKIGKCLTCEDSSSLGICFALSIKKQRFFFENCKRVTSHCRCQMIWWLIINTWKHMPFELHNLKNVLTASNEL